MARIENTTREKAQNLADSGRLFAKRVVKKCLACKKYYIKTKYYYKTIL